MKLFVLMKAAGKLSLQPSLKGMYGPLLGLFADLHYTIHVPQCLGLLLLCSFLQEWSDDELASYPTYHDYLLLNMFLSRKVGALIRAKWTLFETFRGCYPETSFLHSIDILALIPPILIIYFPTCIIMEKLGHDSWGQLVYFWTFESETEERVVIRGREMRLKSFS